MIRFAGPEDAGAVRALWERCFPDEGGFNPYFFAHFFDIGKTLLSVEGSTLCAMVQMLPYRLDCGGDVCEATYIYGACTHPDHRRQGHMARLLEHSFALDRAAGRAASTLIPAEEWLFGFYRPFGYEPFFRIAHREIVKKTRGIVPQRLSEQDIPQLAALYDRLAAPCRIARGPSYWAGQIALFDALGRGVYGWREDGRLAAYAFCWEDTAQEAFGMTPEREQGLLEVLRKDAFTYTACGRETALGCIKWHVSRAVSCGYMNLMLN